MQLPNDKITVSQEVYDHILATEDVHALEEFGVSRDVIGLRATYHLMFTGDIDTAWRNLLDELVEVSEREDHEGIETDAQFIADWTAWAEEERDSKCGIIRA